MSLSKPHELPTWAEVALKWAQVAAKLRHPGCRIEMVDLRRFWDNLQKAEITSPVHFLAVCPPS